MTNNICVLVCVLGVEKRFAGLDLSHFHVARYPFSETYLYRLTVSERDAISKGVQASGLKSLAPPMAHCRKQSPL